MAYGERYRFEFSSKAGKDVIITISEKDYTGDSTARCLGGSPSLKLEESDCIKGSSLAFAAECIVEDEYVDLYTSDACKFKVEMTVDGTLKWEGFLTPELYSAPWIDPPYDVTLTATDGLGELKRYDFEKQGRQTLRTLLTYLLDKTGLSLSIDMLSTLTAGTSTASNLLDYCQVNIDHLEGKTCYDVLQSLLASIHGTICLFNSTWLITREGDLRDVISGASATTINGNSLDVVPFGSMKTCNYWPVGQLSMEMEPARSGISVVAENHVISNLLPSIADGEWGDDYYITDEGGCYSLDAGSISQPLSLPSSTEIVNMNLSLSYRPVCKTYGYTYQTFALMIVATGTISGATKSYYWNFDKQKWQTSSIGTAVEQKETEYSDSRDKANVTYTIPFGSSGSSALPGFTELSSITVYISATRQDSADMPEGAEYGSVRVYDCTITPTGYYDSIETDLEINNGARGEASDVTPAFADTISANKGRSYLANAVSGVTTWASSALATPSYYSEFLAKDNALSFALPRLRLTGKINAYGDIPLLWSNGGLQYVAEHWSWDILNDEIEVSIISLPAASVSVSSITRKDPDTGDILDDVETATSVTPTALTFRYNGAAQSILVNAADGVAWRVTGYPSWMTVSPTSGTGSARISVTPGTNSGSTARTATLVVAGTSVAVTQASIGEQISLAKSGIALSNAAWQTSSVGVTSNASWSISGIPSWLSVYPVSGSGSGTVTFTTTSENTNIDSRSATITFSTTSGVTASLLVSQAGASAEYFIETATPVVSQDTQTIEISVIAPNSAEWQLMSDHESWLNFDGEEGITGTGSDTAEATVAGNGTGSSRVATLTLYDLVTMEELTHITITQEA